MTTVESHIEKAFADYAKLLVKRGKNVDVSVVPGLQRGIDKVKKVLMDLRAQHEETYDRLLQAAIKDGRVKKGSTILPEVETDLDRPRRTRSESRPRNPAADQPGVSTRTTSQGRTAKGTRAERSAEAVVSDEAVTNDPGQAPTAGPEAVVMNVREADLTPADFLPAATRSEAPSEDSEDDSDSDGDSDLEEDELPLDRSVYPCQAQLFKSEVNVVQIFNVLASHMAELVRLERGRASLQAKWKRARKELRRALQDYKNATAGAEEADNAAKEKLTNATNKVSRLREQIGTAESARALAEKARDSAQSALATAIEERDSLKKARQQDVDRLNARISTLERQLAAAEATPRPPADASTSAAVEAAVAPLRKQIADLQTELAAARGSSRMSLMARRRANLYPSDEAMRALTAHCEFKAVEDQIRRVNRGHRSDLRDPHFTLHVILLFACPTLNEGFMKYIEDPGVLDDLIQEPMRRRDGVIRQPGVDGEVHRRAFDDLLTELRTCKGAVYVVPTASLPEMVVLAELVIVYAQTVTGSSWTVRQLRWIMFAGIERYADLTTSEVVAASHRDYEVDYVTKILLSRPDMCGMPTRELLSGLDYSNKDDFKTKLAALEGGRMGTTSAGDVATEKTAGREPRPPADGAPKRAPKEPKTKRTETRAAPLLMRHFHAHPNGKVREATALQDGAINVTVAAQGHCFLCGQRGHYCDECPIKDDRSKWIPLARELENAGRERCLVGALVAKGAIAAL